MDLNLKPTGITWEVYTGVKEMLIAIELKQARHSDSSYLGDRVRKGSGLRPDRQKVCKSPSQPIAGCSGLSFQFMWGSTNRRVVAQVDSGIKAKPYPQNKQLKKG
jgi:hypothetical protein